MSQDIVINKIIKSNRKTIALEINRDAELIVRTPRFVLKRQIVKIINEKKDWINKNLRIIKDKKSQSKIKSFKQGETYLFLGEEFPLSYIIDTGSSSKLKNNLILENDCFILYKDNEFRAEQLFVKWYKSQAREIFDERCEFFSQKSDLQYNIIKINSAKTRWGSCNSKNMINFTFRLVMAPIEVIDYVVVHELCHIKHKNHSHKFWSLVEQIMPDYKHYKQWLKNNGHLMNI